MTIKGDGPAFPQPGEKYEDGEKVARSFDEPGMTLRDYFAAKALPPVSYIAPKAVFAETIARNCYAIADAMLRVRAEKART